MPCSSKIMQKIYNFLNFLMDSEQPNTDYLKFNIFYKLAEFWLVIFLSLGRKYKKIVLAQPIQVIINKNAFFDKNINSKVVSPAEPNSICIKK